MSPETTTAVTAAIVDRARDVGRGVIPADVEEVARQCMLDLIGCALAGSAEPLSRILLSQAIEDGGNPAASLIGHAERVSARQAALLNGAFGHAIDYDDVNTAMGGHPTTAILPAVLAACEAEGHGGDMLLRAFIAGYEAAGMVGRLVAPGHYARGFHQTGTVGAIGAAVGCSIVMGLDAETTVRAVGIAATQAAGLKAQFGTMCKPLHAGKANENGLLAAQLARRGFSSRADILECAQGFARTLSPDFDVDAALARPDGGFHILNNLFKYSAACYGTHGAIEAARALAHENSIRPADIRHVQIRVNAGADRMCNIVAPRTGLEGKFSLRFNTAMALAGGNTSSPDSYSIDTVTRPDLVALQERLDVRL
ncbi:MAG: MmgE/PrpD family protein, partial [Gemmatimonadales bacterium]|nr:MmgE/PrpD family protein [Gemmatimonadales bacterium]